MNIYFLRESTIKVLTYTSNDSRLRKMTTSNVTNQRDNYRSITFCGEFELYSNQNQASVPL